MNPMLCRLIPFAVAGLAACAGKQHVPPPVDSPAAATVSVAGPVPSGMAVTKLNLNRKQCYQGTSSLPQDAGSPMRIASGEPSYFSARYERAGTFCEVIVSFSPAPQASYVLVPGRESALLGHGKCGLAVQRVLLDGKLQAEPVDGWIMRPAGVTCVRPLQTSKGT